ncbi:HutD family protein [Pectobacterium parmentieri]|uniref:HutD family protein n=1 Tax=Pectobacterium parmentieri TaxID=1905730 RepID=A0A0H3IBK1_PECPM|nr:HutD family protein [Pectobacterium parmentieri]ACX90247.1 protein of unknown function DUF886 [Pectobacterium parmentieri WPP163]AFI92785.1 Protein ves [Pectobacterium parmentieri]AYH03625.1 hypothetical protein C5E26_23265 [Pectobacterium parmentieri]AYH07960.1 hypothetical protein C5E25_22760 [Pectobacterium parmentieri]AYH16712.1 hypothetical protein C5E23_22375 [Pectobacterium parmentieri]
MRLLPYTGYAEMRWKNGQGVTREVCRFPAGEQYDWRISIATIRENGAFSRFPGYLRNISVLEGEGMFLTIDGQRSALIPPFKAMDFKGDSVVSCEIVGGPLLDFNVIYCRETTESRVRWMQAGEWQHQQGTLLMFNAGNALNVTVSGERHTLQQYDSLLINSSATVAVNDIDALIACVTLTSR